MEKIININMAGRVIAIEDRAYTRLKAYLETLHGYFAGEDGGDEIINDIESRIAELMDDKIKRGAFSITEADVEEIIGSMGRVEDFAASENDAPPHEQPRAAFAPHSRRSKRFYRDSNDKILGGVCSGIANYMNVDPALVRIVFAILTLGGWGAGLLLYVALWIFVPTAPLESFRGRRLFRDADDKWIGGVCSGMAAYFDKEPWIFRLVFSLPFLLSIFSGSFDDIGAPLLFGSFSGTFVLIYIVLWIVLPLAKTDFQKMEMRGEKVDLASIRENVMADIKDRAKNFSGEVSESAARISGEAAQFVNTRGRSFAREAAAAARPVATQGGHVIGSILKGILLCIGIFIAFGLFIALIGYAFGGFSGLVNDFIMRTQSQRSLGWASVLLFFGVPLLAITTLIVRRVLRIRGGGGRYFALGYSLLWIAGFACLMFLAASLTKEFRSAETVSREVPVAQPLGGRMILTVPDRGIEYSNSLPWLHGNIDGWDVSDGVMKSARVLVRTAVSPDSLYHVQLQRYSRGLNAADASSRAEAISYGIRNLSDSVLSLDNGYSITKREGFRDQNVIIEVQVPVGKKIRFDETVDDKLIAFHIPYRQRYVHGNRRGWEARWDDDDYDQDWAPNVDYVMGYDGELRDVTGTTAGRDASAGKRRDADPGARRQLDSLDRAMEEIERRKDSIDRAQDNW